MLGIVTRFYYLKRSDWNRLNESILLYNLQEPNRGYERGRRIRALFQTTGLEPVGFLFLGKRVQV